jgi:hypothetical protein
MNEQIKKKKQFKKKIQEKTKKKEKRKKMTDRKNKVYEESVIKINFVDERIDTIINTLTQLKDQGWEWISEFTKGDYYGGDSSYLTVAKYREETVEEMEKKIQQLQKRKKKEERKLEQRDLFAKQNNKA